MRPWRVSVVAYCAIWHSNICNAQLGDGSAGMNTVISTISHGPVPHNFGFAPLPTPAPLLADGGLDLRKRQQSSGDICGYVSGDPHSPFSCEAGATCRTDTSISVVHCCPATPQAGAVCVAATTCLDSSAYSSLIRTLATSLIGYETGWCTNSIYPYCVQYVYGAAPLSGFSHIEQCGTQPTRQLALATATSSSSSTRPTTPIASATPTIPPTPDPTPGTSPTTPVGAIVGGVVGGLGKSHIPSIPVPILTSPSAVIGLVILGLFYIHRRKRDTGEKPPPQQHENVGYTPGPDSPPIGYGPPADYRGSMFKTPYETTSVGSPPTSPTKFQPLPGDRVAQYHTPPNDGIQYQTPPGGGMANQGHAVAGLQPPVYPEQRYELPIERGNGEARELRA